MEFSTALSCLPQICSGKITLDCQISFLKLASYAGTSSTGTVKRLIGINEDIFNKTVVILEDIVDTGVTLDNIIKPAFGI